MTEHDIHTAMMLKLAAEVSDSSGLVKRCHFDDKELEDLRQSLVTCIQVFEEQADIFVDKINAIIEADCARDIKTEDKDTDK